MGNSRQAKPPPARHLPGARSARLERCPFFSVAGRMPIHRKDLVMSEATSSPRRRRVQPARAVPTRLQVELLEARDVPSTFSLTPLVPVSGTSPFLGNPIEANDPPATITWRWSRIWRWIRPTPITSWARGSRTSPAASSPRSASTAATPGSRWSSPGSRSARAGAIRMLPIRGCHSPPTATSI